MRETLDQIMIECGSDKATQFTRTYASPHGYTVALEKFLEPIRDSPVKVLEVGVGGGESIRGWLRYFSQAKVYGVDIVHSTNPWNTVNSGIDPRYTFVTGNQSSDTFWECFKVDYGSDWDFVDEDGSHYASDIITTFNHLWPHIKSGGLYIIEDLNTSYAGPPFTSPDAPTQMQFIKDMLDAINRSERSIARLNFTKELCIIQKA